MKIKYYMNKSRSNKYPKNFITPKHDKLSTKIIKNGTILPASDNPHKLWANGGVLDENDNFVKESASDYLFGEIYKYDKNDVEYIDDTVIFFGPFVRHWGHFICDEIGRLWYIKNNPTKYKIAYCGWDWHNNPGNIEGNYLELLELFGCKKNQLINVQKPTKFKRIIIPETSFLKGTYHIKFKEITDTIVKNVLASNIEVPEKVYFSRTKFSNNKERGEKRVERIFKNNGYVIKYPESLSVKEQITLFNKPKKIAMVCGSLSHNLMFAKSNNMDVAILNKFSAVNPYQLAIDSMAEVNSISYIDSFLQLYPVVFGFGPFLLIISKHLKTFLKANQMSTKNTSIPFSPKDLAWYHKTYYQMYKDPNHRAILKSEIQKNKKPS